MKRALLLVVAGLLWVPAFGQESLYPAADWAQRIRIGGTGAFEYGHGQRNASWVPPGGGFLLRQFSGVIDAEIDEHWSFLWELGVLREAEVQSDRPFGLLYAQLERPLDLSWINFRFGRFQTPFGLEYELDYYAMDNPLASNSVAFPYGYDVGMMAFGALPSRQFTYEVAALNGGDAINRRDSSQLTYAGRLGWKPSSEFRAAVSALAIGRQGNNVTGTPAKSAFEWGEMNVQGMGGTLEARAKAVGLDALYNPYSSLRLWAFGGLIDIDRGSFGGLDQSRNLQYYGAEALVRLTQYFSAVRWSSIGGRAKEGVAEPISGVNGWESVPGGVTRVNRISAGIGRHLGSRTILKLEHTWDIASFASKPADPPRKDYWIAQLAFRF